jgi:hypothetical protein
VPKAAASYRQKGSRARFVLYVVAFGLGIFGLASCASDDRPGTAEDVLADRAAKPDGLADNMSEPARCETLDELVIGADSILVAQVSGTGPGHTQGEPPGEFQTSRITLQVSEALKGSGPQQVVFFGDGFNPDGTPTEMEGVASPKSGDFGIYFLRSIFDPSVSSEILTLENPQGRFLRDGDSVRPGNQRGDPLSERYAGMPFSEFRQEVVDSVRRTSDRKGSDGYYCGEQRGKEARPS